MRIKVCKTFFYMSHSFNIYFSSTYKEIQSEYKGSFRDENGLKEKLVNLSSDCNGYNYKIEVFYGQLDSNFESVENSKGGVYSLHCATNYICFRAFVFLILKWINKKLQFFDHINGFIFICKKDYCITQIWVNDGFNLSEISQRYNILLDLVNNSLRSSSTSNDPTTEITIDYSPHHIYKEYKKPPEVKASGFKVKSFGQCCEEISPDILSLPSQPAFNMDVVTIHKLPRSVRRQRQSSNQNIV